MFSERLKNARMSKRLTQKYVAEYLGMAPNAYQLYEYGKREPDFDKLIKLCQLLEVSSDWLLGLSDKRG